MYTTFGINFWNLKQYNYKSKCCPLVHCIFTLMNLFVFFILLKLVSTQNTVTYCFLVTKDILCYVKLDYIKFGKTRFLEFNASDHNLLEELSLERYYKKLVSHSLNQVSVPEDINAHVDLLWHLDTAVLHTITMFQYFKEGVEYFGKSLLKIDVLVRKLQENKKK